MEIKIKKRKLKDKTVFQFYTNCPACDNEIKGTSAKHVEANLNSHLKLIHTGNGK